MKVEKRYISNVAEKLIKCNPLAEEAANEVGWSIDSNILKLNTLGKNCNGVVPIKEGCYQILEEKYGWFREKPLVYFRDNAKKGGPIDVYKVFQSDTETFKVGLEFETGNISSAHRSLNKLLVGIKKQELDLAILMMPVLQMSYYLTDRIANYEELEPYFCLLDEYPFVVFGFDADVYSLDAPLLPKGKDGMSSRSKRKWK